MKILWKGNNAVTQNWHCWHCKGPKQLLHNLQQSTPVVVRNQMVYKILFLETFPCQKVFELVNYDSYILFLVWSCEKV